MKKFFNILGGVLLFAGIFWIIFTVVAVAAHMEGFTTFKEVIPAMAVHLVLSFLGMVFIGLGMRTRYPATR